MKPKKASADWYIAATHWLTTMIAGAVLIFIVVFIIALLTDNSTVYLITDIILTPLIMWPAVIMSANFVNKTYVITDANRIATLSFVYLLVVGVGYRVIGFLKTGVFSPSYIGFILALIVFYFASKKYIRVSA